MGRKKSRPIRSGGVVAEVISTTSNNLEHGEANDKRPGAIKVDDNEGIPEYRKPIFVEVDRSHWSSDEHLDIAEVVLKNIKFLDGHTEYKSMDFLDRCMESGIYLRFRLPKVEDSCLRLGHFPVLSAEDIFLELYVLENHSSEYRETHIVLLSGIFDGPHESNSGLVHLVNQKLVTLRPLLENTNLTNLQTFRSRVEILRSAFDTCESLLEIPRQPWRKSMMNVMN